jgi:hypothetical protein
MGPRGTPGARRCEGRDTIRAGRHSTRDHINLGLVAQRKDCRDATIERAQVENGRKHTQGNTRQEIVTDLRAWCKTVSSSSPEREGGEKDLFAVEKLERRRERLETGHCARVEQQLQVADTLPSKAPKCLCRLLRSPH